MGKNPSAKQFVRQEPQKIQSCEHRNHEMNKESHSNIDLKPKEEHRSLHSNINPTAKHVIHPNIKQIPQQNVKQQLVQQKIQSFDVQNEEMSEDDASDCNMSSHVQPMSDDECDDDLSDNEKDNVLQLSIDKSVFRSAFDELIGIRNQK